jgi:hypothetical protein
MFSASCCGLHARIASVHVLENLDKKTRDRRATNYAYAHTYSHTSDQEAYGKAERRVSLTISVTLKVSDCSFSSQWKKGRERWSGSNFRGSSSTHHHHHHYDKCFFTIRKSMLSEVMRSKYPFHGGRSGRRMCHKICIRRFMIVWQGLVCGRRRRAP